MPLLDDAQYLACHPANYNRNARAFSAIKYLVVHYTGNIGDTAKGNAQYFSSNINGASAHLFVSENSIWQSVLFNYPAYSVGLGSMNQPYDPNAPMYKKITNTNSISIEICGSKNSREATDSVKTLAAKLCAEVLHEFNIPPANIYRHYDVTGKRCPAWAVDDPLKWLDFKRTVLAYYYEEGEDNTLSDIDNYKTFKELIAQYEREKAAEGTTQQWEKDAMEYVESRGLITGGRPHSPVTRGELAVVLKRMNA